MEKIYFLFALMILQTEISTSKLFTLKPNDLCRRDAIETIHKSCNLTNFYLIECDPNYCSTTKHACRIFTKFRLKSAKLERLNYFYPHSTQNYKGFISSVKSCAQQTKKRKGLLPKTKTNMPNLKGTHFFL